MKKLLVSLLIFLAGVAVGPARLLADDQPTPAATPGATPEATTDSAPAVTASDLESLNNRLSALESQKTASTGLKVDGWLQVWYTGDSYGAAKPLNDFASSKNQWSAFSVKRAEVVLTGNVAGDPSVSYKLSVDPAQPSFNGLGGGEGSTLVYGANSAGTSITGINPFTLVKDLYTQLSYGTYFNFVAGQNKLWNALEGRTPSNTLDFNNYSNIDGNAFGNKRDLGVQFSGSAIPLGPVQAEYDFALISGAGQSTFDDNVNKDFAGRVDFTYDNNFLLGASAYDGWEPNGVRQYFGLESRWISGGFKVQGEFLTGTVNTLDNNSANDSVWTPTIGNVPTGGYTVPTGEITPSGYYLLANYRLDDFRLGVRLDGYNFNQQADAGRKNGNSEWDTYTVGLDWFQGKDAYKLSLNWEEHLVDGLYAYNIWTIQSQLSL